MANVKCPISGESMEPVFVQTVLGKYTVTYYYCHKSGLLKTEKPYWLDEAYAEAIGDTDTGLVRRNIDNSNMLEAVLCLLNVQHGKFLDVAGGYGLLARLLRDKGFDCYTNDKYCKNLFTKSFEPSDNFKADALFAFEVLEHIEDPLSFVEESFRSYECRTLIFSTLTFDGKVPSEDWWYYSFEGGQHITFYQPRTLLLIASLLGCKYYMINPSLHIITDKSIGGIRRKLIFNEGFRNFFGMYIRRKRRGLSKTWADHMKMKAKLKRHNSAV